MLVADAHQSTGNFNVPTITVFLFKFSIAIHVKSQVNINIILLKERAAVKKVFKRAVLAEYTSTLKKKYCKVLQALIIFNSYFSWFLFLFF